MYLYICHLIPFPTIDIIWYFRQSLVFIFSHNTMDYALQNCS
jgi:hypothetical protein